MQPRDDKLLEAAGVTPPGSALIAAADEAWVGRIGRRWPTSRLHHLRPGDSLPPALAETPFPLALLIDPDPCDPRWAALLAATRDRLAQRSLVLVTADSPQLRSQLIALGYRPHGTANGMQTYLFDWYDYKDRPEWLNATHWANPELWDKHRW